ncbi:hypothetical protein KSF_103140 [Reticulibacter mediterranei]|uniref:Uncharacterized protein n=1 Tax=Reticulibacter mediterranei TaxID=2778369 RepID=A0A8J3J3W4_9CHLR|nr:hypothetical protein [Reticulibacter mediterranei]GHP00267.1 hypothetical protein KSF_103140 [Reticulibacter mediterranei]
MFPKIGRSFFPIPPKSTDTSFLAGVKNAKLQKGVFIATLFSTFVMEQLVWDTQFISYPVLKKIRTLDEKTFVSVHQEYVKRLGVPIYLPSSVYLLTTLLFLFIRPSNIPLRYPLIMNALNVLAVTNTFGQLVPIHIRIHREQKASAQDVQDLINLNRTRFGLVVINSLIMLYLLARSSEHKEA